MRTVGLGALVLELQTAAQREMGGGSAAQREMGGGAVAQEVGGGAAS